MRTPSAELVGLWQKLYEVRQHVQPDPVVVKALEEAIRVRSLKELDDETSSS